jgi:hypothetical protein
MAQTVALDHFSMLVDQMLEIFTEFNMSVEKTGCFIMHKNKYKYIYVYENMCIVCMLLLLLLLLQERENKNTV